MENPIVAPSKTRLILIASAYFCLLMFFAFVSTFGAAIWFSVFRLISQEFDLPSLSPTDESYWFSAYLFNDLAILLVTWFCFRRSFADQPLFEPADASKFKVLLYGLTGAIAGYGFLTLFAYLTYRFYGNEQVDPIVALFAAFSLIYKILFAILGSLIAPFLEEIFFRRVLFGIFRRHNYVKTGIIISSLLFALAHFSTFYTMGVFYFIAYFIVGVIFALVYHRTNKITAAVIAHVLINTTVFLFYFYYFA